MTLAAVLAVIIATFTIGLLGTRVARTTSDFLVATRSVGPLWNASAISGEYLSAASFLGIAGLIMKHGASAMWYPVGYAAGYLILLLFVAAPLRRFGAYTIGDFAEGRFGGDQRMRRLAAILVLLIALFYLLPQMKGAGVTLELLVGAPYWVGVVTVGSLVVLAVVSGGMKGVTYVQAFHFWMKLVAISIPAVALVALLGWGTRDHSPFGEGLPQFPTDQTVTFARDTTVTVSEPIRVVVDGAAVDLNPGEHVFVSGSVILFRAGQPVPVAAGIDAQSGITWTTPFGDGEWALLSAVSLFLATVLGTMGLPHILVRFYTNRDAVSARRTAVAILVLIGSFYLFPWIFGVLGRIWTPQLYVTGDTDVVVLALPHLVEGVVGSALSALVAAGAFSAFLSTSSGLLVAVAGALGHDLFAEVFHRDASPWRRLLYFRLGAVLGGVAATGLGLFVRAYDINVLVGWTFAIAASAFCPLLILGIWWKRTTRLGAAVGMLVGGITSTIAILVAMFRPPQGLVGALIAQPALVTVPLAAITIVVVSLGGRPPRSADRLLLQMHAPERASRSVGTTSAVGR